MIPRAFVLAVLSLSLISAVVAQPAPKPAPAPPPKKPAAAVKPDGPKLIGKFDDWIAATHPESGVPTCYAFTRVQSSIPTLAGRGGVVLTVTQRPSGRDAVAMEAGFSFAQDATVTVQVDQTGLDFYTHQRAAFARDGHAAVVAFKAAGRAIARSPGPHDATVTDTFSLKGFTAAYEAISKACPPK
jgi:Invasion associated locus B (IalB) protein